MKEFWKCMNEFEVYVHLLCRYIYIYMHIHKYCARISFVCMHTFLVYIYTYIYVHACAHAQVLFLLMLNIHIYIYVCRSWSNCRGVHDQYELCDEMIVPCFHRYVQVHVKFLRKSTCTQACAQHIPHYVCAVLYNWSPPTS